MRGSVPIPVSAFFVLASLAGCAGAEVHVDSRPDVERHDPGTDVVADSSLRDLLASSGFGGTIALLPSEGGPVRCSDVDDCRMRSSPASTFKIVSSILALETGVAPDVTLVIPWDGQVRAFATWNHDMDMREAFTVSCLPYYQELVRRIGYDRLRPLFARLDYGNGDTGEVVDTFWIDGRLTISPAEQLGFLRRLEEGRLPITERTRSLARDLMVRERRGDAVFRGKTGWAMGHSTDERGWFVGYATREGRGDATYVAVRIVRDASIPDDAFMAARPRLALAALELRQAFPREAAGD